MRLHLRIVLFSSYYLYLNLNLIKLHEKNIHLCFQIQKEITKLSNQIKQTFKL
jgi:hypothetical protein